MHSRRIVLFQLSILIVLLITSSALSRVGTAETLSEVKTLNPTADSDVWSEGPDGNTGREWGLGVRGDGVEILAFLMFDLSQIPSGATIEEARLRLYANSVSTSLSPRTPVSVRYSSNNDWTEEGITYNNMPSFSATPIDIANVTSALTWYEWNMTNTVKSAMQLAKKLTIVVKAEALGYLEFRSRNDPYATSPYPETRPQLVVSYQAPPPSTNSIPAELIIIAVIGAAAIVLTLAYMLRKGRK